MSRTLFNMKVHYRIQKSPSSVPILSQISPCPHPTCLGSMLILSPHLSLCLPNGLFPSGFPTKPFMHLSSLPSVVHALPISVFFNFSPYPFPLLRLYRRSSPLGRLLCKIPNMFFFLRIESTSPNLQAGQSPLVGCPHLLIQYIHSHPPCLKAVPPPAT